MRNGGAKWQLLLRHPLPRPLLRSYAAMALASGSTALLSAPARAGRTRAAARRPAASAAGVHEGRARVAAAAAASLLAAGPALAAGGNAVAQVADIGSLGLTLASGGAIAGLAFLLATTDPSKRCGAP